VAAVDKCCILNIGQQVVAHHITINNSVLPVPLVPSVRDLGVVVCADLSTTAHVADIVAKAHKRANLILRAFVSRAKILLFVPYTWLMSDLW